MKVKSIIIVIMCMLICACNTVESENISDIVAKLNSNSNFSNIYRTGYKYYLPLGVNVDEYSLYNEVLSSGDNVYYLYIDLISYYNKKEIVYEENKDAYFSQLFKFADKKGYLEINLQENNQYLIEIAFNYAKIELMVDEIDIKNALDICVAILQSIEYNDNVIANLVDEDILSFQEEEYDIFKANKSESNYLRLVEEDENQMINDEVKDTDLLN